MITDLQEPAAGLIADIESVSTTFEQDGYLWDTTTGECLGLAGVEEQFEVKDLDSAQWVLKKMLEAELAIKGCDDELAVIAANIAKMRKPHENKLAYLKMRFTQQLEDYAKLEVATRKALGMKEKYIQTPYGRLSTRTVKAAWKLKEDVQTKVSATSFETGVKFPPILLWAMENYPQAVKETSKFQVSALPKDVRPAEFFDEVPEHEAVKIETGV